MPSTSALSGRARLRRLAAVAALGCALAAGAGTARAAGPGNRVAEVAFEPAARLGPYRFSELVAVRPGDELTPALVERSLRLLRETGLVAEAAAEIQETPAGPRVLFRLQTRPLVKEVGVRGNFLILDRDLLPAVRLRAAEPFREETLQGDVERLRRHYEEEGFTGTEVRADLDRGDDGIAVSYRVREGRAEVMGAVRVQGNRGVPADEVVSAFGVSRYSFLRSADIQRGLERLRDFYQSRGYLDVRVASRTEPVKGGIPLLAALFNPLKGLLALSAGGYRVVDVHLDIEEGRRTEVSFSGLGVYGESALRPLLTFQRTGFFDEEEVASGRERILAFYQERGYYLAEVDARADYGAGRVVYAVREGRPVNVASVRFRGVTHFDEAWLRARLRTRAGGEADPRLLLAADLARDRETIEARYREAGFSLVEVPPPEVWPESSPAGAEVTFAVREGPRTLLRYISFEGATVLPPSRLREIANLREGDPYRVVAPAAAAELIRAAYARAGYARCTVTPRADFSDDKAAADLRFVIAEGRPRRLGAVAVTGNAKTRREVVLRELPLRQGDPLDPEALAEGRRKLYDLGLFREVRFLFPTPAAEGEPQDAVVAVRERPSGSVGVGAGYASDERLRGFVELGEQNLFGTGRGLRLKSTVSGLGYRHDLFYREPRLLSFDFKGQADLYVERRDEIGYEVARRGLTLGVNRELTRRLLLNLRYRYEFVDYRNVDSTIVTPDQPLSSEKIASVIGVLDYERRDNPLSPHRGSYHLVSIEMARQIFGGDASFTKYELETSWYLPLGKPAELAVAFRGGFTSLLLPEGELPLSERFFLGGDRTVRGYDYKGVGPKDDSGNPLGGNIFALGNVEARFTLAGKLRGVLFFDAGELWADQAGLPSSGLKTSAGAGIRYETLVGPLRLDWGYKLNPEEGESRSRWHLTIGHPF